jgi:hypothetical protein
MLGKLRMYSFTNLVSSQTGWSDGPNFRPLGDYLLGLFFENYRSTPYICATFPPSVDDVHLNFDQKWVGLFFSQIHPDPKQRKTSFEHETIKRSPQNLAGNQGCQMENFQTQNTNFGKFCRALEWIRLEYSMDVLNTYITAIWNILWSFGNLVAIWYIFPHFGIVGQDKSGNPAGNIHNIS